MMMGKLFVALHSLRRWYSSAEGCELDIFRCCVEGLVVWVAGRVVSTGDGVSRGAEEAGRSEGLAGRCCDV
jgi:hypothetical protein